jgi:hypothetical protein
MGSFDATTIRNALGSTYENDFVVLPANGSKGYFD